MPGLPHFLNSRASTRYLEPVYKNLFEVNIIPPISITNGSILSEQIKSIGGLNQDKLEGVLEQTFKGATRSYAAGKPESTVVDMTIDFELNLDEANGLYVYRILRDWARLIYNPLSGAQGLKRDYIGKVIVTNYTRPGQVFWRRTYHDAFIQGDAMAALDEMSYDSSELATLSLTFRSDWWSEAITG
jgi:hypothetical protein